MKLMKLLPPRNAQSDMGLTEREHAYWGVTKEGDRRVRGYPPYTITNTNFRISNVCAYNYHTDVLGRNWIQGTFQVGSVELDEDLFYPAYWDATHVAFDYLWGIGEQDGLYGHKPKVISLVDDEVGVHPPDVHSDLSYAGLYYTAQQSAFTGGGVATSLDEAGGFMGHWNGYTPILPNTINTSEWVRITETPDPMDDGTRFGYGKAGSFAGGVDLGGPFNLSAVPLFPTSLYSDRHDIAVGAPGYGHVAVLWPRVLFPKYAERWYALWQGYIYDRGADPIQDVDGNVHKYACSALVALNAGEAPDNAAAWARVLGVFAPFSVDGPFSAIHDAGDKEHSLFSGWAEQFNGVLYFSASPINLPTEAGLTDADITNDTCIWALDGGGLHESLHLYDTRSTAVAIVKYGSKLYVPMLSVPEQTLFIYEHTVDDDVDHWTIAASTPLGISDEVDGSRPFIATAFGHNGRVSVVWGRRYSIFSDAIVGGNPAATAWNMRTWRIGAPPTASWRTLTASFPGGFSDDDMGIWPRLFPLKITDLTGGSPPPSTGPCDDVFSAFGTSTISEAVFATHMGASPLLGEHTASYFYGLCITAGVNPAYALAQWTKETVVGVSPGSTTGFYNVGLLRCHTWGNQIACGYTNPTYGYFAKYANWTGGVGDYLALISGPAYAGLSISQIIAKYAPRTDHNDTQEYINQLCQRLIDWQAESGL